MTSLQETCEGVLQYLEAVAEGEVPAEAPLVLPSIRCLGRCARDCPSNVGLDVQRDVRMTGALRPYISCCSRVDEPVSYHVAHVTL